MRTTLEETLQDVFTCRSGYLNSYRTTSDNPHLPYKYLNIPINKDSFEVPVFALRSFMAEAYKYHMEEIAASTIAVKLRNNKYVSSYKSAEAILRNVLHSSFRHDGINPIKLEGMDYTYYGTQGALFDKDLNPIMLCIWRISKYIENERAKFVFEKPIVRIDPNTFIAKNDPINRLISGKFVNRAVNLRVPVDITCASEYIQTFETTGRYYYINPRNRYISLVVEDIPFELKLTSKPSILTNNDDLIKVVLNNYQEVFNWSTIDTGTNY